MSSCITLMYGGKTVTSFELETGSNNFNIGNNKTKILLSNKKVF